MLWPHAPLTEPPLSLFARCSGLLLALYLRFPPRHASSPLDLCPRCFFCLKYISLLPPHPFHHHLNWGAPSSEKPSLKPWLGEAPPRPHPVCPPHHSTHFARTGCEPMRELRVRLWKDGTWYLHCPSHNARPTCAHAPAPSSPGNALAPGGQGGYLREHLLLLTCSRHMTG